MPPACHQLRPITAFPRRKQRKNAVTFAGEKHADPADSDPVGGTLNHSAFTTKKRRGDSLSLSLPNMRARDGASISFQTPSSARRLLVPGVSVRKLDPLADDVLPLDVLRPALRGEVEDDAVALEHALHLPRLAVLVHRDRGAQVVRGLAVLVADGERRRGQGK